ncbi:hypothetical protein SKAU_G00260010 [Synaphobranchus kaupii]|uniref:Malic enzyme n=1 Tax=Synaphobranchus kaupii TaxID=118154 RepID=A0A9Q1IRU0_SYNKA|nr:hypothetical protein SKAU_G00260010 [Synaphobranchus kaupii]
MNVMMKKETPLLFSSGNPEMQTKGCGQQGHNRELFIWRPSCGSDPLDSQSHWQTVDKRRVYGRSLREAKVSMSNGETSLDQLFRKITATSTDKTSRDTVQTVWQQTSRSASSQGTMNTLPRKSVLALCRNTSTCVVKILSGRTGHPAARSPSTACLGAVRVCHTGTGNSKNKNSVSTKKRGYDITRNPHLNKGMAFTLEERLQLGIHGLLPPCFLTQDVQVLRVMKSYEIRSNPLDKYILLMTLQDRNEKLFYRLLTSDIEEFMPIVYTPTVGLACQQYGLAFRRPRGLFITIHDKGHIATVLNSWPEENIKAIVVTDGERILGLGDLGSYGMGIPVGKLALYTACGGVPPQQCLPVLLDVGTDNQFDDVTVLSDQVLLDDPLYIGLKHKRVRGKEYDDLIDEFMQAVTDKYGMNCLIQFEDFANSNAFRILNKYRNRYCTFNDDIQGYSTVWKSADSDTAVVWMLSQFDDVTVLSDQVLLDDPLYIGLKHKRVRGKEYDDLIDEFMQAVTDKYGMNCLIQFEDFANSNAFRILNKYRNRYCTFNDDIQGTASVAVAGILAALRVTKNKLSDHKFVFQGAGEGEWAGSMDHAALGIAHLLIMAMGKEGIPHHEAVKRIWMVDSKGLIVKGRGHLNHEKEEFAQEHPHVKTLEEVVQIIKPSAIIGVAAVTGAFTEKIIKDMASFNERPHHLRPQ